MEGQRNTDWPVVGQSALTVLAHVCNLKSDIQELLMYSESSDGDTAVAKPIPHDVFKCFSDSVLAFLEKIHDQPSLKDLAEAIERVNQTTRTILKNVQASKQHVQGGQAAATNTTTATAPAAAQAATIPDVAMEQPTDLPDISPQMAAAMKNMPPKVVEEIMEARRRGQASLQTRASVAEDGVVSKLAPSNITARPAGTKATGITPKVGETSKLVLQSQNTEQGNVHEKTYNKLDSTKREIRLLKLYPESDPDCDIRCELSTVSLDTRPIYKALSYTWGDANDTAPIILDGHRFPVTRNLKKALLKLRALDTETLIWIDAICINQANTTERTQQVDLMRVIFESTTEVIVWLGETASMEGDELWDASCFSWHADESDFPRINSIMAFSEAYSDTFPEKLDPRSANPLVLGFCLMRLLAGDVHLADIVLLKSPNLRMLCINALSRLVAQPWWNRIWVIQEVILPSSVTLIFGRFSAPLRMYADASSNLRRHMSSCCANVIPTDRHTATSIEKFCQKVLEVVEAENLWSNKYDITLLTLFRLFYWRDATDARDKVYGLLSLVTAWGNGTAITPDYTISLDKLHQEVAIKSIETSGTLAILRYRSPQAYNIRRQEIENIKNGLQKMDKSSLEPVEVKISSWADLENQDGTTYRKLNVECINRASIFDAAAGKPAPFAPLRYTCSPMLTKTQVLTVSVVHIGTISSEGSFSAILVNQIQKIYPNRFPLPAKPGELLDKPYLTGGNEYDALWRTLCADSFFASRGISTDAVDGTPTFRRATQDDLKAIQAWRRWIEKSNMVHSAPALKDPSSSKEDALIADADRAIRSATVMRRLFKTDTKYMGLAAAGVMPGDEVYVLLGSSTPFALRLMGEAAVEGLGDRRCYTIMGECYVHGIMDGELVKQPNTQVKELCLI